MPHAHDHDTGQASDRRIAFTVALNGLLTVAQIVGGALSGSLALIADALHNLNDAMALAIVWGARRIARRDADRVRTFGYRRARTIGAMINLVALGVVALFLAYESLLRFLEPREVGGWIMIAVAGIALLVDAVTVVLLAAMRRGAVDLRTAFVHNVSDALASVAVMIGGAVVLTLGWTWVDPALSLLIVGYVGWQVAAMLPQTVRVLMDSAPPGLDVAEAATALRGIGGVTGAHHLHAWSLDEQHAALEAHLVIERRAAGRMKDIKAEARRILADRFGVHHATLELEFPETAAEPGHDTGVVANGCCDPPTLRAH